MLSWWSSGRTPIWAQFVKRTPAALILVAGAHKATDPTDTLLMLRSTFPLGAFEAGATAVVAMADVFAGTYGLLERDHKWRRALIMILALLFAYTAVLVYVGLTRGWSTECGCGLGRMDVGSSIMKNVALAACAVAGYWLSA